MISGNRTIKVIFALRLPMILRVIKRCLRAGNMASSTLYSHKITCNDNSKAFGVIKSFPKRQDAILHEIGIVWILHCNEVFRSNKGRLLWRKYILSVAKAV